MLSSEIRDAIDKVVKDLGQSNKLSARLIAWLDEIATGQFDMSKNSDVEEQISLLLSAVTKSRETLSQED